MSILKDDKMSPLFQKVIVASSMAQFKEWVPNERYGNYLAIDTSALPKKSWSRVIKLSLLKHFNVQKTPEPDRSKKELSVPIILRPKKRRKLLLLNSISLK